mmetsp:Transcript_2003/g.4946  ORF Transcript_2003/g.4946 Transcript_2003/m.4946 type:complete len:406 (-) Transcript_2003:3104-4321(-)
MQCALVLLRTSYVALRRHLVSSVQRPNKVCHDLVCHLCFRPTGKHPVFLFLWWGTTSTLVHSHKNVLQGLLHLVHLRLQLSYFAATAAVTGRTSTKQPAPQYHQSQHRACSKQEAPVDWQHVDDAIDRRQDPTSSSDGHSRSARSCCSVTDVIAALFCTILLNARLVGAAATAAVLWRGLRTEGPPRLLKQPLVHRRRFRDCARLDLVRQQGLLPKLHLDADLHLQVVVAEPSRRPPRVHGEAVGVRDALEGQRHGDDAPVLAFYAAVLRLVDLCHGRADVQVCLPVELEGDLPLLGVRFAAPCGFKWCSIINVVVAISSSHLPPAHADVKAFLLVQEAFVEGPRISALPFREYVVVESLDRHPVQRLFKDLDHLVVDNGVPLHDWQLRFLCWRFDIFFRAVIHR